jgi:O-antigen/teichoic acid export membrane protein
MLLRHSAYYLLARGVPGVVNFSALAVYTRLLAPEEFGRYALVLVGVGLVNVIVFQWLRLVLARFLQAHNNEPQRFLAGILALFLTLAVAATGVGALLAVWWPDPVGQRLLALAVPLLLAQAWFELNLELVRARLEPRWYGRLLGSKAMLSLAVGGALAWIGLGAAAPLIGLLIAHVAAFLIFALVAWRGIAPRWPEAIVLRKQLSYGLPLTVTFALAWVVSGSDRLLLAWLMDEHAVGVYAVGYDLSFQGLTLLLTIINTAAFPLVVNALEKGGAVEARKQLAQNGELVIAAAFAGAAGFIVLGPHIVTLLIGEVFRAEALRILPWVAAAAALAGIKAFHFDLAFHLGRNSRWLVVTAGVAAITNLALNLLLIPAFGILGAAWGTLGAYGIAALTSAVLGRYSFAMPALLLSIYKSALVALATGLGAWLGVGLGEEIFIDIGLGLLLGAMAAMMACLAINFCGLRAAISRCCLKWIIIPSSH